MEQTDRYLVNKLKSFLDQHATISKSTELNVFEIREKQIQICEVIFRELSTAKGKAFLTKFPLLNNVIVRKLKKFYNSGVDSASKWWYDIYDEEFPKEEPEEPEEPEEQDEIFESWAREMISIQTPFSFRLREEHYDFLKKIWTDMNNHFVANVNTYELMMTGIGQFMIHGMPVLRKTIKEYMVDEIINGDIIEWKDWWHDMFGCEYCDDYECDDQFYIDNDNENDNDNDNEYSDEEEYNILYEYSDEEEYNILYEYSDEEEYNIEEEYKIEEEGGGRKE